MFANSRPFLIIVLALLQLLAPLVHAHTSGSFDRVGLHVPGLEMVNAAHITDSLSAVNGHISEGLLIGIDAGIRQNLDVGIADANQYYDLPVPAQIAKSADFGFDVNFSPPPTPCLISLKPLLHAPRAPPAIINC